MKKPLIHSDTTDPIDCQPNTITVQTVGAAMDSNSVIGWSLPPTIREIDAEHDGNHGQSEMDWGAKSIYSAFKNFTKRSPVVQESDDDRACTAKR